MYRYKVSIEIIVLMNNKEKVINRLVTVEVDHREEALLQAFFQVQDNHPVGNVMSVKISDWKEISGES